MSKNSRQRKLKLLKSLTASQNLADKLKQETKLNILQTSMMENELIKMKESLESLEKKRSVLITRIEASTETLAVDEKSAELSTEQISDTNDN